MSKQVRVPVEELCETPYAAVLCYPSMDTSAVKERVEELRQLGIEALEPAGEKRVGRFSVLGKGHVGVVVKAHLKGKPVALKARRADSARRDMRHEAEMLRKANAVQVGPELLAVSDNFVVMQLVNGRPILSWLATGRSSEKLKETLRNVLEQCYRLDRAGLDHGELSHAPKHVIVKKTGKAYIVDFEAASSQRTPSNVTSICSFLFIGEACNVTAEKLGPFNKEALVRDLRAYKRERTRESFGSVLRSCGLQTM